MLRVDDQSAGSVCDAVRTVIESYELDTSRVAWRCTATARFGFVDRPLAEAATDD